MLSALDSALFVFQALLPFALRLESTVLAMLRSNLFLLPWRWPSARRAGDQWLVSGSDALRRVVMPLCLLPRTAIDRTWLDVLVRHPGWP